MEATENDPEGLEFTDEEDHAEYLMVQALPPFRPYVPDPDIKVPEGIFPEWVGRDWVKGQPILLVSCCVAPSSPSYCRHETSIE